MARVLRIPIDIRSPEQTGIAGNSFWTVRSGTVSQMGYWAFLGNTSGGSGTGVKATGGIVYGLVNIPINIDLNTTPRVILSMGASATAASLSAWRVASFEIATGIVYDPASWQNVNAVNWTAPTTAWSKYDLSFTLNSATTGDMTLAIKIERDSDGTSATENCTAVIGVFDAFLEFTATA